MPRHSLRYPRNFTDRIRNCVRNEDKNCQLCERSEVRAEVYHLFSWSPKGNCYDHSLSREFIQSPDNAVLICRQCYGYFRHILRFLSGQRTKKPWIPHNILRCYICHQIATHIETYKNPLNSEIWKVSYCLKCLDNARHILSYMAKQSKALKFS